MATDEAIPNPGNGVNIFSQPLKAEPRSLVRKLAEVMAVVERVPKNGTNDFFHYKFALYDDIISAVRQEMSNRHLILIPNVIKDEWLDVTTQRANKERLCTLTVAFTISDGDSGEERTFNVIGQGQDAGDKASYKALTSATKVALLKLFMIPTGDEGKPATNTAPRTQRAQQPPKPAASAASATPTAPAPTPTPKPEEPKSRKLDLGTDAPAPAPDRKHEDISFAKGTQPGVKISKLDSAALSWYADALQKTLEDNGQANYHKAATHQLACVQSELRYRDSIA